MEANELLENYREQIDTLDKEMLYMFHRRFEIVKEIWKIKKQFWIDILQQNRWKQLLDENIQVWNELSLDKSFVTDIWEKIHLKSLEYEKWI